MTRRQAPPDISSHTTDALPAELYPHTLAGVLNHLIERRIPGLSNEKIVREISKLTGYELSSSSLQSYRAGRRSTANAPAVHHLATYFDVHPDSLIPPYRIIESAPPLKRRPSPLADRLNDLIDGPARGHRKPITDSDLAAAAAAHGAPISPMVLGAIRAGDPDAADSLTLRQIRAMATTLGQLGDAGVAYLITGIRDESIPAVENDDPGSSAGTAWQDQIQSDDAEAQRALLEAVTAAGVGLTPAALQAAIPAIQQVLTSLRVVQNREV